MEAVYVTHYPIPELGAEPGDHLVVEAGQPSYPLHVVKAFDHHALVRLMGDGHLDRLTLVSGEASRPEPLAPSEPFRKPRRLRMIRGGA